MAVLTSSFFRFLLIIPRRVFRIFRLSLFYRFFTWLFIFFPKSTNGNLFIFAQIFHENNFLDIFLNKNTVASFSIFHSLLTFIISFFLYFFSYEAARVAEQNDEKKRTCYVITVIMVSIYNILIKSRVCFFFLESGA